MRKLILAAALSLLATPVAAQTVPQALAQLDTAVAGVKVAIASQPVAAPVPAPTAGTLPTIASTWTITAQVGMPRGAYFGNLPGGCPCTWSAPFHGKLTGASPQPFYTATSAGQDTFTVRTADGALHAFFVSNYP